jgi:hypothetical protein
MVPLLLLCGETLAMTPSCHVAMLRCFSRHVSRDWRLHLVATGFSTLSKWYWSQLEIPALGILMWQVPASFARRPILFNVKASVDDPIISDSYELFVTLTMTDGQLICFAERGASIVLCRWELTRKKVYVLHATERALIKSSICKTIPVGG